MNLTTVRQELVNALATVAGLEVSLRPPVSIDPPHAWISDTQVQQVDTSGAIQYLFTITVVVSGADTDEAHAALDVLVADIDDALTDDLTHGTVDVIRYYNIGAVVEGGAIQYPSFQLDVEVIG